ncbi:MAG: hypothetical protein J5806_10525 [Lentisphaeria bacterium]|nr:hypothetical protein [Lentisphaeria bacterium]
MRSLVKILLFLLVLPILIVFFFTIVIPLGIILLLLSLFIPSIRLFHISETPRARNFRRDAGPADDAVDVECTVVDTTEENDRGSGQNKDLNP